VSAARARAATASRNCCDYPSDSLERTSPVAAATAPPFYERDREIADLEVWLMLSDLEHHANWGV
jgi:hypothetical protein